MPFLEAIPPLKSPAPQAIALPMPQEIAHVSVVIMYTFVLFFFVISITGFYIILFKKNQATGKFFFSVLIYLDSTDTTFDILIFYKKGEKNEIVHYH
ncbi:MAG: hypothetical protein U5K27_02525 [Desulfotignum sp.]|nr:hypothetical protein [Desulfotignum sp.]